MQSKNQVAMEVSYNMWTVFVESTRWPRCLLLDLITVDQNISWKHVSGCDLNLDATLVILMMRLGSWKTHTSSAISSPKQTHEPGGCAGMRDGGWDWLTMHHIIKCTGFRDIQGFEILSATPNKWGWPKYMYMVIQLKVSDQLSLKMRGQRNLVVRKRFDKWAEHRHILLHPNRMHQH